MLARDTPCGGSLLPSLVNLSLAKGAKTKRTSPYDLDADSYERWLNLCIELHDFLKRNNVPKNPECGQIAPLDAGSKRRARDDNIEVECSDDGYIMRVDFSEFYALGSAALAPLVRPVIGGVSNAAARVIKHMSWSWVHFPPDTTLAQRLAELQKYEPLNQDDWCVYGANKIPLEIFRAGRPVDASQIQRDSFTYELLTKSSHVYLSKDGKTIAFATSIENAADAVKSGLPWVDASAPYLYVDLICSREAGGGIAVMMAVAYLVFYIQVRYVYMSALSHVVFLYARKANAKFIDRDKDEEVPVPDWWVSYEPTLEPLSRAQAAEHRLSVQQKRRRK